MSDLVIFEKICEFISDLAQLIIPDKNEHTDQPFVDIEVCKSLDLYRFLVIEKTTIAHKTAINKHVEIFRDFCIQNREAIYEKDASKFVVESIVKSDKVRIDIAAILKSIPSEHKAPIWKYLLYISAFVDPQGRAKELYQQSSGSAVENSTNLLTNLFDELKNTTEQQGDDMKPQDAVQAVLQSDFASKLTGALSSGELDMKSLFGGIMNMANEAGDQAKDDPEAQQALSMINGIMGMMSPMLEGMQNGNPPSMSGILQSVTEQTSLDDEITKEALDSM